MVLNMLSDFIRENGRTMIIATHDREMGQIADQVLELREEVYMPWMHLWMLLKNRNETNSANRLGHRKQPK